MTVSPFRSTLQIGSHTVGVNAPPLIVAELSGNHNRSLERALATVDAMADAGVQAFKLQTFTAESMTLDLSHGEFMVHDESNLWHGETLYQLYEKAMTPWEWHQPIFERCRQRGIVPFSTPFDAAAVDFLETLDVPCYKIASLENTDIPLIRRVVATGRPVIISTGLATLEELDETVDAVRKAGGEQLILLKCTTSYPAPPEESNLRTIPDLARRYGLPVGLSDHTLGIGTAIAAVAMGACLLEKHVTLSREDGGVDAVFSLEPQEMAQMVEETRRAWQSLGGVSYGPTAREKASLQYRRSLYAVRDIGPGEALTAENVRAIRPGLGLSPRHYDAVLGRRAKARISRGTPLEWDLLE